MSDDELLARYLLARILWWRHDLEQLDAAAVAAVIKALDAARRDIAQRLSDEAAGLANLSEWRKEHDAALDAWADEVLAGARASILGTVSEATIATAAASLTAYGSILSVDGMARGVATVGMTREQVAAWFQDTALGAGGLEKWVDTALDGGVKNSILAALRQVGVEGKGTAEAVRRVLLAATEEGMAMTRQQAVILTRTFIQTANVRAQEAVWAANHDIIKGYKRIEVLDTRICMACALADGAVYGVDEERPPLPAHPGCRGMWLPVVKTWRELGLDLDDTREHVRQWAIREPGSIGAGGRKLENFGKTTENYSGWWRSLSPEDRDRAPIGPVRRKLLESGAVQWDDLWDRKTGLPRTLAEVGYYTSGKNIYEEAKSGGRHAGWYRRMAGAPDREIKKSITSFEKLISEHSSYLENPKLKVKDWDSRSVEYQNGLKNLWERQINKQREQLAIIRAIKNNKGE